MTPRELAAQFNHAIATAKPIKVLCEGGPLDGEERDVHPFPGQFYVMIKPPEEHGEKPSLWIGGCYCDNGRKTPEGAPIYEWNPPVKIEAKAIHTSRNTEQP